MSLAFLRIDTCLIIILPIFSTFFAYAYMDSAYIATFSFLFAFSLRWAAPLGFNRSLVPGDQTKCFSEQPALAKCMT